LYGYETWSLTLREEHRLRVFENRVLRRIFGTKRDEVTGEWRKLHSGGSIICTHHQILLGRSNQGERGRQGMWHAWEWGEKCTGFWWKGPREKDHLKEQGVDGRMGSKWILGRLVEGVWSRFSWLRIGIVGGLL
jgi:hypothetical protein